MCYLTCKKSFIKKGNLTQHKWIQTGIRPYSCNICQFSFADNNILTRHKKMDAHKKSLNADINYNLSDYIDCGEAIKVEDIKREDIQREDIKVEDIKREYIKEENIKVDNIKKELNEVKSVDDSLSIHHVDVSNNDMNNQNEAIKLEIENVGDEIHDLENVVIGDYVGQVFENGAVKVLSTPGRKRGGNICGAKDCNACTIPSCRICKPCLTNQRCQQRYCAAYVAKQQKNREPLLTCEFCERKFRSLPAKYKHLKNKTCLDENAYEGIVCKSCRKQIKNKSECIRHMKETGHSNRGILCSWKSCTKVVSKKNLNRHMQYHDKTREDRQDQTRQDETVSRKPTN